MVKKQGLYQRGYTLIELAIVMLVLGLLFAAFAGAYNIYHKNKVQRITVDNTNRVVNAIGHYLIQNGRYPCPAPMDAGRDDAEYGVAGDCEDTATYPVGTCVDGICVEAGERLVNVNPNPGMTTMVTPRVRRGAVPFRSLALPEDVSEDGNKQKLYYAVTENLAVTSTYRKDGGGISVVDADDNSAIFPESAAHFIVLSVGDDGRGAYTRYGQLKQPCLSPAEADDAMNCHTGSSGVDNRAVYRVSSKATTSTSTHYDDHVKYYSSNETPLWRVTDDGLNIADLMDVPSGGKIGVGNDEPKEPLDVDGNMRIRTEVGLNELCNNTSTDELLDDCFDPNLIGGNAAQMNCPSGFMVGIQNGEVICSTEDPQTCTIPGQVMVGINADGSPNCVGVTGCAAETVNLCYIDGNQEVALLPSALQGQEFDTIVSGISFQRHFVCNNSEWQPRSPATSGICSCTPVEESNNVSCHSWGVMPGSGTQGNAGATRCTSSNCWTGTATRTFTRTCPDGVETTGPLDNSGCSCIGPYTQTRTRSCSQIGHPGWSWEGTQPRQTTTWTCTSATSGVWSGWELIDGTDTCQCEASSETRNLSCSSYYNSLGQYGPAFEGSGVPQTRHTTCPGPTTGSWTNDGPVNCTCNEDYKVLGTDSCPPGEVGSINWHRAINCATGQLGPKVIDETLCSSPTFRWTQSGQQIPGGGPLPNKLGVECYVDGQESTCSIPQGSDYAHFPCRCQ